MPSQKGELVSCSTSQPWPIICIHEPALEMIMPIQRRRKSRTWSASNIPSGRRRTPPSVVGRAAGGTASASRSASSTGGSPTARPISTLTRPACAILAAPFRRGA